MVPIDKFWKRRAWKYGTISFQFKIWQSTWCVLTLCKVWSLRRPHWQEQSATGKAVKASSLQFPRWHLPLVLPPLSLFRWWPWSTGTQWDKLQCHNHSVSVSRSISLPVPSPSFQVSISLNIVIYKRIGSCDRCEMFVEVVASLKTHMGSQHDRSKWQAPMPQSLSSLLCLFVPHSLPLLVHAALCPPCPLVLSKSHLARGPDDQIWGGLHPPSETHPSAQLHAKQGNVELCWK